MKDRVVLVTGGAGNLGRAVTRGLLRAGARVAVPFYKTDQPSALDTIRSEFGDRFHSFALDLTTERGAEQAIRQVAEWGGKVESVAHLVGGYAGGTRIAEMPVETWNRMVELNMTSAYLVTRFALPALLEAGGGSFVFVSSRAAFEGRASRSAYAATKAGLVSFARAIADEYGAAGVRANIVVPDTIDTDDNRAANPGADTSRWVKPEDIAEVIVFLASHRSRAINGAAVPVYGGPLPEGRTR
ncbi:MAG: SDR family oxidoreductase [Gemmatimonas sp.]|nr:SDR family oxidoreductase [Gemmatimonas sp.]